jgi:hypothetical protein
MIHMYVCVFVLGFSLLIEFSPTNKALYNYHVNQSQLSSYYPSCSHVTVMLYAVKELAKLQHPPSSLITAHTYVQTVSKLHNNHNR